MSTSDEYAPLQTVTRKDGKVMKFIYLSRSVVEIVELKDVDLHIFWHNVVLEKNLLAAYPEEPPHHYVARDRLPMIVEA